MQVRFRPHEAERYKRLQGGNDELRYPSRAHASRRHLRSARHRCVRRFSAAVYAQQTTPTLETVTVTAQRRETDLQTTPVAISAYGGEQLVENKIFTAERPGQTCRRSPHALTPLDAELNIRGITNTRLDSPTADPSVGTFVDGVYIGRTGDLNYDFYDLERIEVIRGPQGVLLGKNVVGGALSVITAKPTFDSSGNVLVSYGNYNAMLVRAT